MREERTRSYFAAYLPLLAIVVSSTVFSAGAEAARPNPKKLVDQGAVLLDVRSEAEFKRQHLDGAINIPLADLPYFLEELGSKKRPVVVYCQSGGRSKVAANLLRQNGFRRVVDMGAMNRWFAYHRGPYSQR